MHPLAPSRQSVLAIWLMARSFAFATVDVFTDRRFGGNPLAVFPAAEGLTDAEMQALAGEFNLSETTFVLPPSDPANTARVRIFTPKSETALRRAPERGHGLGACDTRAGSRMGFSCSKKRPGWSGSRSSAWATREWTRGSRRHSRSRSRMGRPRPSPPPAPG